MVDTGTYDHDPDSERLVELAYGLALSPETVESLYIGFGDVFLNPSTSPSPRSGSLETLDRHARSAMALLKRNLPIVRSASRIGRNIEETGQPTFILSTEGVVLESNDEATQSLPIRVGKPLRGTTRSTLDRLKQSLSRLENYPRGALVQIFALDTDTEQTVRMALTRDDDWQGHPVGLVTSLSLAWRPSIGRRFADALDLTDAERDIVRAIVTGLPLAELAQERGTKASTVRNQTKRLLRKTGVGSQTELACLYAGFAQASPGLDARGQHLSENPRPQPSIVVLSEGHCINFTVSGSGTGRPVVFLPNLLFGQTLPPNVVSALYAADVKLIVPWRAGFSGSMAEGGPSLERHADEIAHVLDRLGVETAPVVGQMTSSMYALAGAKNRPDRLQGVVLVNPGLPMGRDSPHTRFVGRTQRIATHIAQKAPHLGRLLIHAVLARIANGHDVASLTNSLRESRADLDYANRTAIIELLRQAYSDIHSQGPQAFIDELELFSSDWFEHVSDVKGPVRALVGEQEPHFPLRAVAAFATDIAHMQVVEVKGAGHLAAYQKPQDWIDATDFTTSPWT